MFDIVKREHIWLAGLTGFANQRRLRSRSCRVCLASNVPWGESLEEQVFLIVRCLLPRGAVPGEVESTSPPGNCDLGEGRTWIMRAIKCLKSIRWMPWR